MGRAACTELQSLYKGDLYLYVTFTQIQNRVLPTELQHSTAYPSVFGYNNNFFIMTEYFIEKYGLRKFA